MKSEIKDNLVLGENANGTSILAMTAGKREAGAPKYTFGFTARGSLGPVELGVTAKRTGERYIYDNNEAIYTGTYLAPGSLTSAGATPTAVGSRTQVYSATAAAYWLVNLDARVKLEQLGLGKSYLQLNVYNLFNQFYVGGFGGNAFQNQTFCPGNTTSTACNGVGAGLSVYGNTPNVQIGAPRTVSGTVVFQF